VILSLPFNFLVLGFFEILISCESGLSDFNSSQRSVAIDFPPEAFSKLVQLHVDSLIRPIELVPNVFQSQDNFVSSDREQSVL
jgi:hypothetical protein